MGGAIDSIAPTPPIEVSERQNSGVKHIELPNKALNIGLLSPKPILEPKESMLRQDIDRDLTESSKSISYLNYNSNIIIVNISAIKDSIGNNIIPTKYMRSF